MAPTSIDTDQTGSLHGILIPARTVAAVNVTLSGVQNINGATGASGDRVLLSAQTDPTENGVWVMLTGTWERPGDSEDGDDLGGMLILIVDGVEVNEIWRCENAVGSGVIGTDSLTLSAFLKGDPDGHFEEGLLVWNVNGVGAVGTLLDGIRTVKGGGQIVHVVMTMAERGNTGTTRVDILKHAVTSPPLSEGETQYGLPGTTIYGTTPANRPNVQGDTVTKTDSAIHRAYDPDTLTFSAGDFFTIDIVEATGSARDVTIIMTVRYE